MTCLKCNEESGKHMLCRSCGEIFIREVKNFKKQKRDEMSPLTMSLLFLLLPMLITACLILVHPLIKPFLGVCVDPLPYLFVIMIVVYLFRLLVEAVIEARQIKEFFRLHPDYAEILKKAEGEK
jgi:hypothetical protein